MAKMERYTWGIKIPAKNRKFNYNGNMHDNDHLPKNKGRKKKTCDINKKERNWM